MSKPTNLGRFRKQKARDAKARGAAANRAREGQTAAERAARAKQDERRARLLEGARREGVKPE
jgi:hypothetical protein